MKFIEENRTKLIWGIMHEIRTEVEGEKSAQGRAGGGVPDLHEDQRIKLRLKAKCRVEERDRTMSTGRSNGN